MLAHNKHVRDGRDRLIANGLVNTRDVLGLDALLASGDDTVAQKLMERHWAYILKRGRGEGSGEDGEQGLSASQVEGDADGVHVSLPFIKVNLADVRNYIASRVDNIVKDYTDWKDNDSQLKRERKTAEQERRRQVFARIFREKIHVLGKELKKLDGTWSASGDANGEGVQKTAEKLIKLARVPAVDGYAYSSKAPAFLKRMQELGLAAPGGADD